MNLNTHRYHLYTSWPHCVLNVYFQRKCLALSGLGKPQTTKVSTFHSLIQMVKSAPDICWSSSFPFWIKCLPKKIGTIVCIGDQIVVIYDLANICLESCQTIFGLVWWKFSVFLKKILISIIKMACVYGSSSKALGI